jgi:hypothetical protein
MLSALALAALACDTVMAPLSGAASPTPTPLVAVQVQPTAAPPLDSPAGEAAIPIPGGPTVGAPRETRIALSDQLASVNELAPEEYSLEEQLEMGRTFAYTVQLPSGEPRLWFFGWCATSSSILQQNLEHMTFEVSVDDTPVPLEQFEVIDHAESGQGQTLECRTFVSVISDWPDGETTLRARYTFDEKLNDGMEDYGPGTQLMEYTVTAP